AENTLLTGGVACYQVYETSDQKHLAVGALELKFWQAFCDAIGLSELKNQHWELGEAPGSPQAKHTIERVARRIAKHALEHWLQIFEPVDACVTPVLTPAEALNHPHHHARNLVHHERGISEVGPLAQMTNVGWQSRPAPRAGQHTRAVLKELNYSAEDIERLIGSGAAKADR
ncbi:MAG: CoA transferase, partial [Burkholderiaceae bacterium]